MHHTSQCQKLDRNGHTTMHLECRTVELCAPLLSSYLKGRSVNTSRNSQDSYQLSPCWLLSQQIRIWPVLLDDHGYREDQARPIQLILILLVVQAVPKIHGPIDHEIRAHAGHYVPGRWSAQINKSRMKARRLTTNHVPPAESPMAAQAVVSTPSRYHRSGCPCSK